MLTIVHDTRPQFTAHVWLNDLPDWPSLDPAIVEVRLPALPHADTAPRCAALEYDIPSCKGRYGAIGARFDPDDTGVLAVRLAHSARLGPRIVRTQTLSLDLVHQGLPSDYTDGVLAGVKASGAADALGSGTVYFGWAAHGLVGSSQSEFGNLTRALIQILAQLPASGEAIAAIIALALNQASAL